MLQRFDVLGKKMDLHDNGKTCIFVYKTKHFILGLWSYYFVFGFLCLSNDEIDIQALFYLEFSRV
jgi:hypothetical protein